MACLENDVQSKNENIRRVRGWSRFNLTVEPILFTLNFLVQFNMAITIDLIQLNVCLYNFNMTIEECSGELSEGKKAEIESLTADVSMVNNIIQGLCPVILVVCVGPWSDENGRKPFIQWGIRGFIAYYTLWGIFSMFSGIPAMWFIIPAIPLSLSGGWVSALVCCQSYTADIWHDEVRPFRISLNVGASLAGSLLANAIVSKIFYASGSAGYQVCYFSSACIAILLHLYVSYVLKETVIQKGNKTKLLDIGHIKDIVVALLVKPRVHRINSYLTLTILGVEVTSVLGEYSLSYLIGKSSFDWTLGDYNLYNAVITTISAVSPIIILRILKTKLKLHSYPIIMVFSLLMFVCNMMKCYSSSETMFWIVACLLKVVGIIPPCIDSELSLLVNQNDIGKAYAYSSLIDALTPVIAIPMFTALYKSLLPDNTLKTFLLPAAFSFITLLSSIILLVKERIFKSSDKISSVSKINDKEMVPINNNNSNI